MMQVLLVSRLSVLGFGLFSGVFCIILLRIGININWLFFVVGLLVASVFPPISFLITWNKVPKVFPCPPFPFFPEPQCRLSLCALQSCYCTLW